MSKSPRWWECRIKKTWSKHGLGSQLDGRVFARKRTDTGFEGWVFMFTGSHYNLPLSYSKEFAREHLTLIKPVNDPQMVENIDAQLSWALSS